jgi:hypothetical protein
VFLLAAALVVLLIVWASVPGQVNQDVAWSMLVAQRLHAGATLYRDVLDINPPLIFWLASGAAWIGRSTDSSPINAYYLCVMLVLVGSLLLAVFSTRRTWADLIVLTAAYLAVGIAGPSFGQREQLISALCIPLIVQCGRRADGEHIPTALLVSGYFLASLAFCLKPHFAVLWPALLLLVKLRSQRILPADALPAVPGLMYIGAVALIEPAYFQVFHNFGPTYLSWNRATAAELVSQPGTLAGVSAFLLALLARAVNRPSGTLNAFALASMSAVLAACLQGKAFGYHWLPALAFSLVTAALVIVERGHHRTLLRSSALLVALVAIGGVAASWHARNVAAGALRPLSDWIAREPRGTRALILSRFSVGVVGPSLEAGLTWSSAWQVVWWPSVFPSSRRMPESFGALPQAERTALDASVRALLQGTVDVVAVDLATTALGGAGTRFEMDQYFRLVPGVKWALARQFAPPRKESGFIVYRRQQPGAN